MNSDGHPDIAFANSAGKETLNGEIDSVVYFGSTSGFDPKRKRDYPTRWANRCASATSTAMVIRNSPSRTVRR